MSDEIRVLCNISGHDQRLENIKFRPGIYRGYEFIFDLQSSHDAYCTCEARIDRVYKVEREFPAELNEEPEEEISLIGQYDSMLEHFPRQPYKRLVNITCDAGSSQATLHQFQFSALSGKPKRCVDKTRCIVELPAKFKRLLLRPPRFGKTTLLSTLAHYYDIHNAQTFHEDFGALAVVTKAPVNAPPPTRHLCLVFRLSQVLTASTCDEFAENLKDEIALVLEGFLSKYAEELQIADPFDYIQEKPQDDLLNIVIDLARTRECTIFVIVDDYDAPIRDSLFPNPDFPPTRRSFATQAELEDLMDLHLWAPLCAAAASDVVHKLFFTGTLPLKTLVLQDFEGFHLRVPELSPCGFSKQEAQEFSEKVMDDPFDDAELRRLCGQYIFPHPDGATKPVFHPQQLISGISAASSQPDSNTVSSFRLLAFIFRHLPEESDVAGAVTVAGLVDLIATGAIETDARMDSPVQLDELTVTWRALYYLGAVTYDLHLPGTLRVGHEGILPFIHSRIDRVFGPRHDLKEKLYRVWRRGDANVLPELLTEVLRGLAARSFGKAHEPDLRGVCELVMGNTLSSKRECIMGPLELFSGTGVSRVKMRDPTDLKKVCYWELRTLSLRGLWRARNPNDDEPTAEALQTLHEELTKDEEEQLLERPYAVWSPSLGAMEIVLVRSFLEPDTPLFLAIGGARVLMRP
ncbi:hypothetical protein C8R47DRAFT_1239438 [Mycena vitilis]|nr:hypothetical protein C8R47DRAFT_1239438 [Mycena vitilis]